MPFETSQVYQEVLNIVKSNNYIADSFQYRLELYVGNETLRIEHIEDIYTNKNYVNSYAPSVIVTFMIGNGTYDALIVPKQNELRARLIAEPVGPGSNIYDNSRSKFVIDGKAATERLKSLSDNYQGENFSIEAGNKSGFKKMRIQIINPILESTMSASVGGTYRKTTSPEFVKSFLSNFSKIAGDNINNIVNSVNMVEDGLNKEIIPNIMLPSNIKMVDVPGYVNSKVSGVYPTGFGYFLDKTTWFVYPIYNVKRAENCDQGILTVLKIPRASMPEIKNTYRYQGKNVFVVTNSDLSISETNQTDLTNKGNSGRWVDSKKMMDDITEEKEDGRIVFDASKNVNEVTLVSSASGFNTINGTAKITSNKFYELSKLAQNTGSIASFVWDNSYADLIYPGMPVKLITWNNDVTKIIYGTVINLEEQISIIGKGLTGPKRFSKRAVITLFMESGKSGFNQIKSEVR